MMSRSLKLVLCCLTIVAALALAGALPLLGDSPTPKAAPPAQPAPSPAKLDIEFVPNSTSSLIVERDGKRYLVDLQTHAIREADASAAALADPKNPPAGSALVDAQPDGAAIFKQKCASCHGPEGKGINSIKTPDFSNPAVQASLTDQQITDTIEHGKPGTMMPAWNGKLSQGQIDAVRGFLRSLSAQPSAAPEEAAKRKVYEPGDDLLFSLPTGRRVPRHGMTVNFTHRFVYTPAFTGPAVGASLFGLDDYSISSFGLRYGLTDRLSVSVYRSPSFIARPIQLMAAYNFLDEHDAQPINAAVRVSIQGENNFSRNYTENLEGVFSRSIGSRVQFYGVPTLSLNNRVLFQPNSFLPSAIPDLPGRNTFSLGVGGAFDIRPTAAIVAEVIPTLAGGRALDIHRPAYSIGIQKKIWRHSFTFGVTTSPGTTVAQRAGTRAQFLDNPAADKPGGLFVGFDLSRELF
jgi:mono/diheme cytochrome c family protein